MRGSTAEAKWVPWGQVCVQAQRRDVGGAKPITDVKPITKLLARFQYGNTFPDYNNKFELEWKMYA